jgi:hypothetical protein
MSVSIIWSLTNGGSAISNYVDHGDLSNGSSSSGQEIFVRHDGTAKITDVAFYIREYSGTYNGDATSSNDFTEIIAWGDAATAAAFGGVMINWDATGGYAAAWPTYNDKEPGSSNVHRTGVGDSLDYAITLPTSTGAATAGEIISSAAPNVRFKMRIDVPTDEDTVGVRLFDQVCTYTYTS